MNSFEITIGDIQNILLSHDTSLPRDVVDSLHDELMEYYPEIIRDALNFSTDLAEQTNYMYSVLERIMVFDGLYITEPYRWSLPEINRLS